MADLTLGDGAIPCRFRALTVDGRIRLNAAIMTAQQALQKRYGALVKLKGDEFFFHPDYPEYMATEPVEVAEYPYIAHAWAGDGDPPTIEQYRASTDAEAVACLAEIRRLNPRYVNLPEPPATAVAANEGAAIPVPTTAA
jgi:hypothetical protein